MEIKNYSDFINNIHNRTVYRERTEWSNTWIDNANDTIAPPGKITRYLLIGDSTVRMVRSTLAKLSQCPVDMIGTSAALYDTLFVNLVDAFFKNNLYHYDVIFVQLGHHGVTPLEGGEYGSYTDRDYEDFEYDIRKFLLFLKQYSDRIVVESIFDSVIPTKIWKKPFLYLRLMKEKPNIKLNSIKHIKNKILAKISTDLGMDFLDINSFMIKKHYIHKDHIHYENRAKKVIARKMLQFVNKTSK